MTSDWPRLALSAAIVALFGYALVQHYSDGLEEVIKNAMLLSVGYWLGSSKGSTDKTRHLAENPSGTPADPVNVKQADE
jgi:hypothetical protein